MYPPAGGYVFTDPPGSFPSARRHGPSLTPLRAELLKDMVFEGTLMDDPVLAADGRTYNRDQIERWMKLHDISPYTHLPLEHKKLVSNTAIRRLINMWCELHGHPEPVIRRSADGVRASHRHRVIAQLRLLHSPAHETLPPTSQISSSHQRKRAISQVRLAIVLEFEPVESGGGTDEACRFYSLATAQGLSVSHD
jgi:hypothetical protein